jgi:squalene cyclase
VGFLSAQYQDGTFEQLCTERTIKSKMLYAAQISVMANGEIRESCSWSQRLIVSISKGGLFQGGKTERKHSAPAKSGFSLREFLQR